MSHGRDPSQTVSKNKPHWRNYSPPGKTPAQAKSFKKVSGHSRAYSGGLSESVTRGDRRQGELEFERPLPPLVSPPE
jgi:hypothetical protein